jgi:hypothetical protein
MDTSTWSGYGVYAGRVRLGAVERTWCEVGSEPTVIVVRGLFPGLPPLLIRLGPLARVSEAERRIDVGPEPGLVFDTHEPGRRPREVAG